MENLSTLINSVNEKTILVLSKLEGVKAEKMRLAIENEQLRNELELLKSEKILNAKVINIAPENYATAQTESVKKTIDEIVGEIDQALALLTK